MNGTHGLQSENRFSSRFIPAFPLVYLPSHSHRESASMYLYSLLDAIRLYAYTPKMFENASAHVTRIECCVVCRSLLCVSFFSRCSLSMLLMEMNFVDGRESTDFLQRLAAVVRYNQVLSIKPAFVCILRENCDCVLLIIFIGEVLRTTSTTTTRQTATIEFVWEVSISVLRLYRSHCILRHFVVCFLHGPIHIQAVSKQQRLNNNNDRFHFSTD